MRLIYILTAALFFGAAPGAWAVDCGTNCASHCSGVLISPACIAACEVEVASACAATVTTPQNTWQIHAKNNCRYSMQVAAHYMTTDHRWVTDGWWQLNPGEDKYIFDTKNRYIYVYGETTPHRQITWSGNHTWPLQGRSVGFRQKSISAVEFGTYTESFSCN